MSKAVKKENEAGSPVFETDVEKITNRHLADQEHVITEEEMRDIRIGMKPESGTLPEAESVDEAEERVADEKSDKEDDTLPGTQKMTPWDVIDPS